MLDIVHGMLTARDLDVLLASFQVLKLKDSNHYAWDYCLVMGNRYGTLRSLMLEVFRANECI